MVRVHPGLLAQRLTTALATPDAATVRREAWRAVDALRAAASRPELASGRIELARGALRAMERLEEGASAGWNEVQDLMASAILDRIVQLDAARRLLPALGLHDAPSAALLVTLRRAFRREQAEALRRVGERLGEPGLLPDTLAAAYERGWVRLCAWCERVAPEADVWLPIGHYVPQDAGVRLTHTICPSCADTLAG